MPYGFTGTNAQTVWISWQADCTNVTAAAMTTVYPTNQIWPQWVQGTAVWKTQNVGVVQVTPEEAEERRRVVVEQAERARKAEAAKRERAKALLREALTRKQQKELEKDGYFHVVTKNGTRRYRLKPGAAPVRVEGEDGRRWSYCIHPAFGFPPEDVVLAQKLLLETDEEAFLRIANASELRNATVAA